MERSEMNAGKKALHTQKVCEMIEVENRIRIKKTDEIKRKIARLTNQLKKADEKFKDSRKKICLKEDVSEIFITKIMFGKTVSDELKKELLEENTSC